MESLKKWVKENNISEIECVIPDMNGMSRGKLMPARKFINEGELRLPETVFAQTITGDYPDDEGLTDPAEVDLILRPDFNTTRMLPWSKKPRAQIIHDCYDQKNKLSELAPRSILKKVIKLYDDEGLVPVVAPELEFFLTKVHTNPDYPLEPPTGRSGRQETGRQPYGMEALDEFNSLYEDIYHFCEIQKLDIDTLIHEEGVAQLEMNFLHGNPLELADQVFLFKRTVRKAAIEHNMYATFMAKPMEDEAGNSMHIHQSVVDKETQKNIFVEKNGKLSKTFLSYIAGLQKYLPKAMLFFAPNVNSYRRIKAKLSAPINVEWGYDNRTVGLRVPFAKKQATRLENRVAGADANPYLVFALSLICGYLGMKEKLEPAPPFEGDAYQSKGLPTSLQESLKEMEACETLKTILGERFVKLYILVKEKEYETYSRVISPWEREFLLLNI